MKKLVLALILCFSFAINAFAVNTVLVRSGLRIL